MRGALVLGVIGVGLLLWLERMRKTTGNGPGIELTST